MDDVLFVQYVARPFCYHFVADHIPCVVRKVMGRGGGIFSLHYLFLSVFCAGIYLYIYSLRIFARIFASRY